MVLDLSGLLDTKDELNVYLVANSLKPAASFYVNPKSPKLRDFVVIEEEDIGGLNYGVFILGLEPIGRIREILQGFGVSYRDLKKELIKPPVSNGNGGEILRGQKFLVGSNQENLERLITAKTEVEIGLALGFPEDSIMVYNKTINGERRDGAYVLNALAKARKSRVEIPSWLAYVCFIPDTLDLVNGVVSRTSEELGRHYQNFVKEKNPELAERVEQNFFEVMVSTNLGQEKNDS